MTDTPDWWQEVFSQREISELEQTASNIIEQQPADDEEITVTLTVAAAQVPPLLERLAVLYEQTPEGDSRDMVNMIGIVLASEYYEHYDIDEPKVRTAIGEFIDLDAIESDDDDEEDEDE